MPNSDFSSFLRHRFSYVVRIVELLRTPTISMRQWTLIQSILLYFYRYFILILAIFIQKKIMERVPLYSRIIKIKRRFYHPREKYIWRNVAYKEYWNAVTVAKRVNSFAVTNEVFQNIVYGMCLYTQRKEKFHETNIRATSSDSRVCLLWRVY